MQIVEFLNEFHVSINFGWRGDKQKQMIKDLRNDKGAPIARWNHTAKAWVIPISYKDIVYHFGKFQKASHIIIKDNLPERIDVIPELGKLSIKIPLKKGAMRPYQEQGVARMIELKKVINGDQPGLGKTLQSIAAVCGLEIKGEVSFPVLVICPSALKINWKREFEMWTNKKAMVLTDSVKTTYHRFWEMEQSDVFIVNFESMKKYFVKSMPDKKNLELSSQIIMDDRVGMFKTVIIDESHRLKDPKSIQAKIAINLTKGKENIFMLTGTPVVNKPIDLFAQLAIMYRLKDFGGVDGFKTRYCQGGRGASNLAELNYLLNMNCFFQRKKEDVLKDLPAISIQNTIVSITNLPEFNKVKNEFAEFLRNSNLTDAEIRKKINAQVIVQMKMLIQISAKGKIEAAKEHIDEIIASGQKIVIFCMHQIVVDLLKKEYPKAVTVTGKDNSIEKQRSVDGFQNNPGIDIIIVNYKAGGVGITLTAASELLLIELPWTQADIEQAVARCHRMGQQNSVRATVLIGEHTLDQHIYDLIQEKKVIANTITGTEDDTPVSVVNKVLDLFK
jgi:SWI/SNF-related matrix-associated actin-dependent regulator of chromatin subfamily A-like protein 1